MTIQNPKRAAARIRYQRDVAIAALVKARRHKKASKQLLTQVLECVAALRKVAALVANDNAPRRLTFAVANDNAERAS